MAWVALKIDFPVDLIANSASPGPGVSVPAQGLTDFPLHLVAKVASPGPGVSVPTQGSWKFIDSFTTSTVVR